MRGSTASGTGGKRIAELDGIRGIAVLLVLFHHYGKDLPGGGAVDRTIRALASVGWIGVDMFFVLSGYLITGVLLKSKGSPYYFRHFLARRALRIFPPYYALLFVCFVVAPTLGVNLVPTSRPDGLWFWLYGSNLLTVLRGWPDRVLTHLWSLAVEEHFYLIWPLLILLVPRQRLMVATALVAVASAGIRVWGGLQGWEPGTLYVMTPSRLDGLAAGATLCAILHSPEPRPSWLGRAAGTASLSLAIGVAALVGAGFLSWTMWNPTFLSWGLFALAIGMAGALAQILELDPGHPLPRLLRSRPLLLTGRLSYGLYLYHMVPIVIAHQLGLNPAARAVPAAANWPYFIAYCGAQGVMSFVAAALSYRLMEGPLLRFKDRAFGRYTPPTPGL